jgi:hypothetical protein
LVHCDWVYLMHVASNVAQGRRERRKYKARFVERGFTQIYTSHASFGPY